MEFDIQQGSWVARLTDEVGRPMIGKVKEVHHVYDEFFIDVVIYDASGEKIGRESPAEGGPRGFEPMCDADAWVPIEKPNFDKLSGTRYEYRHLLNSLRAS